VNDLAVFLGGEGRNELGTRAAEPAHQTDSEPGVIVALLSQVRDVGWSVTGACTWKSIVKLRATGPTPNEERNVLGLVHEARRAKAAVVAFIRDANGDAERSQVLEAAIAKAASLFPTVRVIGGATIPVLEGWLLALLGTTKTEELSKTGAQRKLSKKGIAAKDTEAMVSAVSNAGLARIPPDAVSLRNWLERAKAVLSRARRAESGPPEGS
jgi:hypothetical protein